MVTTSALIAIACFSFLLGLGACWGILVIVGSKRPKQQEVPEQPKPERSTLPLSCEQYAVLFYCLDCLRYEENDILQTPDLTSEVKEISHCLFMNLVHEDSNLAQAAEIQADNYRYYRTIDPYRISRREGQIRAAIWEDVAKSYLELAKEIEECRDTNDWERVRKTATDNEGSAKSLAAFYGKLSNGVGDRREKVRLSPGLPRR